MVEYVYDAWGKCKVLNPDGTENTSATFIGNVNPFRYRGYYFDTNTGLYYLKSRFYDPETGRFLNADTIDYLEPDKINGLNLYAYCGNNPIMNVDPSGHAWWNWVISAATIAIGVALCFLPGAQALGVGLLVGGTTSMASNIMEAAGVDGKTASIVSSVADVAIGVALCFTPFAGLGASMIGSGIGGIAGGYISEALGGSFELGATIGNIAGGILGGKVYSGIRTSQLSNRGAVVLGEGMERVRNIASKTGAATYGGMPGFKTLSKFFPQKMMNQLGLAHNATWIKWVMKAGADIIDIGISGRNSPNYLMEILYIGKYLF